ncbi:general odorant-binding protein 83a-like isoform X2 [Diprion similis]|uniref:general odorant-binding protein 83a-like isoform X2 n=1 Tax=Diprion similis TaxID=362088 RepID=UPI001EF76DFC|nr:general odorant-binding protein 83a-like isoform X2 [Diprion similis]
MSTVIYGLVITLFIFGKSMADDGLAEMMKMLHDTCVGETGVAEDVVIAAKAGNFAEDPKLKCFMLCLLNEVSAFDDGEIDIETLIAIIPESMAAQVEPIIRNCGVIKGSDDCDTAFLTNKCWYNENPALYADL